MTSNAFSKGFKYVSIGEMKACAPSPFVKERGQIVVGVDQVGIVLVAAFDRGIAVQREVIVNARIHVLVRLEFGFLWIEYRIMIYKNIE